MNLTNTDILCPYDLMYKIEIKYDFYIIWNFVFSMIIFIMYFFAYRKPKYQEKLMYYMRFIIILSLSINLMVFVAQFTTNHGFLLI